MVYFSFSLDPVHCSTKLSVWAGAALYFLVIGDYGREQINYRYVLYMTPLQKARTIPLKCVVSLLGNVLLLRTKFFVACNRMTAQSAVWQCWLAHSWWLNYCRMVQPPNQTYRLTPFQMLNDTFGSHCCVLSACAPHTFSILHIGI